MPTPPLTVVLFLHLPNGEHTTLLHRVLVRTKQVNMSAASNSAWHMVDS